MLDSIDKVVLAIADVLYQPWCVPLLLIAGGIIILTNPWWDTPGSLMKVIGGMMLLSSAVKNCSLCGCSAVIQSDVIAHKELLPLSGEILFVLPSHFAVSRVVPSP